VFIGKPCDVAGLRMAQALRPQLTSKTALALGFFCAGTPSTRGTLDHLGRHDIEPLALAELRYRGMGWPGMATARRRGESEPCLSLTYEESWGFLQKYRPFRCYLCPDTTAEFADISVGDAWYHEIGEHELGRSLVVIRTSLGREVFHRAVRTGYVQATRADAGILLASQGNLLRKRRAIWGRLLALGLFRLPYPRLRGFQLFQNWLDLSAREKLTSLAGTGRRIIQRRYFEPVKRSRSHAGTHSPDAAARA